MINCCLLYRAKVVLLVSVQCTVICTVWSLDALPDFLSYLTVVFPVSAILLLSVLCQVASEAFCAIRDQIGRRRTNCAQAGHVEAAARTDVPVGRPPQHHVRVQLVRRNAPRGRRFCDRYLSDHNWRGPTRMELDCSAARFLFRAVCFSLLCLVADKIQREVRYAHNNSTCVVK